MRDEEVVGIGANDDAAEHLADTGRPARRRRSAPRPRAEPGRRRDRLRDRPDRRRRPGQPQHGARGGGAQPERPDRHPDVRPGARLAHPGALPRCRRPVVVGARGARLRVGRDRRRDRHALPAGRPAPRVARIGPTAAVRPRRSRSPGCTPTGRVELLPDAPRTDPDLILVDVGDAGAADERRAGRRRRRPAARSAADARPRRVDPGPLRGPGAAPAAVRRDPRHPRRRLGDLLRRRRRPDAARRGLVRDHAADRRLAAGRHRGRRGQHRRCASTRSS